MLTISADVVILGAGTAGMAAYHAASVRGARAILVESGEYGTTCARVGCMPSKLLIAAAAAAHAIERAADFGVEAPGGATVDGARVLERVTRERDRFVGFVTRDIEAIPAADRRLGAARFLDDHSVRVGTTTVRAKAIVIATGSRPARLPMFDGLGDRLVVSDDVFRWKTLPGSIAVFGPGLIGLELGQALSRLGVRVRLFGAGGRLGPLTDPVLQQETAKTLGAELGFRPEAKVLRVARSDGGVLVTCTEAVDGRAGGAEVSEHFDLALAATGRVPNVDDLDLDRTSLELDGHGVPTFDRATLRCGTSSIFVAGDASASIPLLHEAQDDGRIAGRNAATFPTVAAEARRSPLSIVFTEPQIAMVGESWAAVHERDPVVGRVSFEDQGRSRVLLVNRGALHVYVERQTGRLLGAEMIGPAAEHLAHLLAWAHQLGLTVASILKLPFYHPVIEEGIRTALLDARRQLSV